MRTFNPAMPVFLAVLGSALLACAGEAAMPNGEKTSAAETASSTSSSGGSSSSSGGSSSGGSSSSSSSGSTEPRNGILADCTNGEGPAAPSTPEEMNAWLQTRAYQCWERESIVHSSDGPHGGNVKVFLNAALAGSMKSKSLGEHPKGSVAVKELYNNTTDTVNGWAVGVKTADASGAGAGWYWYEVFSTNPGDTNDIEGQNRSLCTNCHASGRDFVLITYPLR